MVQQASLLENPINLITELNTDITAVLASQMMVPPIAMKSTDNYIADILCKKLDEVKQRILIVLRLMVTIEYIMATPWNSRATSIISV